jgi:membrane peptidoglycan carboxypeptidase
LSDNRARTPAFGASSFLNIPGVAVKTGTTNDYRDAWIVGYSPEMSVASWAGNNDNRSMEKRVAGFIVAPMWNEFMQFALSKVSSTSFIPPAPMDENTKPVIAGNWQYTNTGQIHSILHWVDRSNPLGAPPRNPSSDSQYWLWENAVQSWLGNSAIQNTEDSDGESARVKIINPQNGQAFLRNTDIYVAIQTSNISTQIIDGIVRVNGVQEGKIDLATRSFSFVPENLSTIKETENVIEVELTDNEGNRYSDKNKLQYKLTNIFYIVNLILYNFPF